MSAKKDKKPSKPQGVITEAMGKRLEKKLDTVGSLTPEESAVYNLWQSEKKARGWHWVKYGE